MADCLILTFNAVARAAVLEWSDLQVRVEGTLDRREGVTAFTAFRMHATLGVGAEIDESLARRASSAPNADA